MFPVRSHLCSVLKVETGRQRPRHVQRPEKPTLFAESQGRGEGGVRLPGLARWFIQLGKQSGSYVPAPVLGPEGSAETKPHPHGLSPPGKADRRLNSPQRSPQGDPYRSDKRPVGGKPRPDWRVTAELKDQEEPGLGRGARRASWTEGAEARGPQGGELGPCPARKEPPAPAPERRLSRSPCAVLPPRVHSAELQGPEWEPELCPPPPSHPRCPLLPPARGAHHTRNKTSATTSRGKAFCHPASVLAFHHFTTS